MEQRNILWGEVVGGLLIVGCSIALVISLWQTLEENPLYQAAIFVSVTAGLFGAGLYTLSHWKLESTSRGLLVIATLLVPLNLLAMTTGPAQGGSGPLAVGMELAALLIFGGLLSLAGKVLVADGRWRFAGTILALSAWQLLVVRLLQAPASGATATFLLLGGLPVAVYGLGSGSVLYTTTRRGPLEPRQASALYGFLGMAIFALSVTLGQLVFRSVDLGGGLAEALGYSAPLIGLAGWPPLLGGILVRRGLPAEGTGGLRTAGTATSLFGMVILTAAVVLAWPRPVPVLVACTLNVLILAYVAFRHDLPVAHVAVIFCVMLAYLAGFDLVTGKLAEGSRLGLDLAVTAASGQALVGLVLALALTAEGLYWRRLAAHAGFYAVGAGGVALLSLLGVIFPSQGAWAVREPVPAVILCAVYGAVALAMNLRQRRPILSSLGVALLAAATLWALWAAWPQQVPRWGAVLAAEALILGVLAVVLGHPLRRMNGHPGMAAAVRPASSLAAAFAEPLARSGEALALLALVAGICGGIRILVWSPEPALTGSCLTGLFLLLAAREHRWLPAVLAGCLLTATAIVFTGWAGTVAEVAPLTPWLAFASAACSTLMATIAVAIGRPPSEVGEARSEAAGWSVAVLGSAWLETAALAGIVALMLAGASLPAGTSPLHTYTAALLTVTALLLTWGYQAVALSWLGAVLALGGITHALDQATDLAWPAHLLDFALLTHATLLLLAGLGLRYTFRDQQRVTRLFTEPFRLAGLIASFAALPLLLWPNQGPLALATLGLFWLSAIWLAIAWLRRWPGLFTAFQAVLTLAVVFASLTWLGNQDWFRGASGDFARFWDPRSCHAYGLGLALLSLAWVAVRIVGRSHSTAQMLLEPGWPGVDRLVLMGLVIGQMVLAILAVAPALAHELSGPTLAEAVSVWPAALRPYTLGLGAWLLLGLVGLALVVALWERWAAAAVPGLVLLAVTVPILWAGSLEAAHTTGLALRWGLAGELVGIATALWWRSKLRLLAAHLGWPIHAPFDLPQLIHVLLNGFLAIPVIALAILAAFNYGGQEWPFGSSYWLLAGIGPLAGVCLVWVGHAWRERSAGYAFAAGCVVNLAASLIVWHYHPGPLEEWRVLLVQVNVIVAALVALLWLGLHRRMSQESALAFAAAPMLTVQMALVLLGNAVLLIEPLTLLILEPGQPLPLEALKAGQLWGWVALILALMAAAMYALRSAPKILVHVLGGFGLAFGALAACTLGRSEVNNWPAFHGLLAAWTGIGPVALALGWTTDTFLVRLLHRLAHGDSADAAEPRRPQPSNAPAVSLRAWVRAIGVLAVLLALRGAWAEDPGSPYWPAGASLAVSLTFGAAACWSGWTEDIYASGLLLNLAGGLVWQAWSPGTLSSFTATQVLCLALGSGAWSALGLGFRRPASSRTWPPYPHFAAALGLGILGVLAAVAVSASVTGERAWAAVPLTGAALGVLVVALVLLLWDATARFAVGGLYALGLIAVSLVLHSLNLGPRAFGWHACLALAGFVLLTAALAWIIDRLPELRQALRLPDTAGGQPQPWYLPAQGSVAGLVLLLSVWMSLDFSAPAQRLGGSLALTLLIAAGVLMAAGRRQWAACLQRATLLLGVAAVVEAGWAVLDPAGRAPSWLWLHRSVIGMVALAFMTVLYGVVFSRWLPGKRGWAASCRRLGPMLGLAASVLVAVILVQEATLYEGHKTIATLVSRMLKLPPPPALDTGAAPVGAPMAPLAIGVVAVALLALIGAGIRFAVLPGADPLGLTERGRTLYVYATEVLLVLMFVHFRLTVPGVFRQGFFLQYWPFVIMAIAFAGVALAEFLSRQGIRVLAEPLERTGVFLPLLPVLAFWVLPGDRYALLWFTAGLVYAFLFVTRRSFLFGLCAALAANMGLWVLLYHHEWYFYVHPQVWLIPLALIALVSEHANRDRLTASQSAGLRYLALLVIYLSSTADLFIAGLGRSLVLTLVLTVLSVLGVLAGMLLRVRAFLFLGVTFLLLVILTMIWHAGVDQQRTWVLWSAGIVLGVAILTLFGIFEKRRNDVLRLVDELRQWD
jgi:hypothetical protein